MKKKIKKIFQIRLFLFSVDFFIQLEIRMKLSLLVALLVLVLLIEYVHSEQKVSCKNQPALQQENAKTETKTNSKVDLSSKDVERDTLLDSFNEIDEKSVGARKVL